MAVGHAMEHGEHAYTQRRHQAGHTPLGGLAVFGQEWEAIVLAELHLRLQPVVGMMEAWGASPQTTQ